MPAAELQLTLHRAGVGPAAVVPVPSGTVLLLSPAASLTAAIRIALECRKIAGRAAVLCWDDVAAISYSVLGPLAGTWYWGGVADVNRLTERAQHLGPVGRAASRLAGLFTVSWRKPDKVDKVAGALTTVFGAHPQDERIRARVAHWETGGPQEVAALLDEAGLPDVHPVVDLVHAGHADPWVAALAPPAKPPVVVLGVVIALVCCATTLLLGVPVWFGMLGVVLAVPSVLLANAFLRRSVRRKPINAVLPAIPVTQGAVPTEQPPA